MVLAKNNNKKCTDNGGGLAFLRHIKFLMAKLCIQDWNGFNEQYVSSQIQVCTFLLYMLEKEKENRYNNGPASL